MVIVPSQLVVILRRVTEGSAVVKRLRQTLPEKEALHLTRCILSLRLAVGGLRFVLVAEHESGQAVQTLFNLSVVGDVPSLVFLKRLSILKELLAQFNTFVQVDAFLLTIPLHQVVVFLFE